jgi:hypothetical protein
MTSIRRCALVAVHQRRRIKLAPGRARGQIIFEEFGASPGNSYPWVELHDDLTVSLLQARLIELNLPINVAIGTRAAPLGSVEARLRDPMWRLSSRRVGIGRARRLRWLSAATASRHEITAQPGSSAGR